MSCVCCFEFAATSFFFLKHFKICLCWNSLAADPQNIPLTLLLVKVSHPKCLLNSLISPSLHVAYSFAPLLFECLVSICLCSLRPTKAAWTVSFVALYVILSFYFFIMGDFFCIGSCINSCRVCYYLQFLV